MPDDIVTRLRVMADIGLLPDDRKAVAAEAADEIERLRADKARYAEIVRIKDKLINKQVQRIMYLEGVRG